jgi:uncharacterized protein YbjQ (UPF0145 family)
VSDADHPEVPDGPEASATQSATAATAATEAATDLPEAVGRRLTSGAWSSGLSVADFAACVSMGLRPLALVQGFCAMQWSAYAMSGGSPWGSRPTAGAPRGAGAGAGAGAPYASAGSGSGYNETWPCPHGIASLEHRWGGNYEQPWAEHAWSQGFGSAYTRMVEEAQEAGAHGIIDVVDTSKYLSEQSVIEFHVTGTAVAVEDAPALPEPQAQPAPWSTYLAGQRLAKLFEAGFVPVSVAAAMSSVMMWPNCQTEYLLRGTGGWGYSYGGEIEQVINADTAVRRLARAAVRSQLGSDTLHGARFAVTRHTGNMGGHVIECTLRGTRVRRFKDFDPLPAPRPTVRLS